MSSPWIKPFDRAMAGTVRKEDQLSEEPATDQNQNNDKLNTYENGRQAALKSFEELMKRLESAIQNLEKSRESKDLVTFVYWFVLIHEYQYMLNAILLPTELQRIYDDIERFAPREYLVQKRQQCYVRLPDYHTVYGQGYNLRDIIGCALDNRCAEEILTFIPDTDGLLVCGGQLKR